MITENNLNKLQQIITELNDWDALELCPAANGKKTNYYIPYMMNDALEYYAVLEDCRIVGDFYPEYRNGMTAELIKEGDKTGLIIRQEEHNVCTLWFRNLQLIRQCYQYHRIGHFWVSGQEQWRQLVYMVGTIYDKQDYIGSEVCNKKEQELLPLMNFPPFLMWFPLNEIPWDKYPCTKEGCECMRKLALEAGDKHFARLIKLYEKLPLSRMTEFLGHALTASSRIPLYNLIFQKVCSASEEYPTRNYGKEHNRSIEKMRLETQQLLRQKGFTGNYPYFEKDALQIFAAEEHPFTVMESQDFHFRIQFMVSQCPNPAGGINSGFFRSRNNIGAIEKDLSFLD